MIFFSKSRFLTFFLISYLNLQAIAAPPAGFNALNPAYFVRKKVVETRKIVKTIPTPLMTT
jgi:hypothetical protein